MSLASIQCSTADDGWVSVGDLQTASGNIQGIVGLATAVDGGLTYDTEQKRCSKRSEGCRLTSGAKQVNGDTALRYVCHCYRPERSRPA